MANTTELTITLPHGRRIDAQLGEHTVHTDQPKDNGGEDTAVSPFQLFLASIGTCAGIFIQGFCAKREIPTDNIRIHQHNAYDEKGVLTGVDLEVELPPDFPAQYREAVLRTVEGCSVKKAIQAQPTFTVRPKQ